MTLNRNPNNFFAEVEQLAFCPANLIPGIEPSPDLLLAGRLFSYSDTQRHRYKCCYCNVNPYHEQLFVTQIGNKLPVDCSERTKEAVNASDTEGWLLENR